VGKKLGSIAEAVGSYDVLLRGQKVHSVPLRKSGVSLEADLEHEAWKDLLCKWRSQVSCLSAELVHLTADVRLSPIFEKIRCESPAAAAVNTAANTSQSQAGSEY